MKKCLKCLDVSSHLDASFSPHFRISVCLFFLVLFAVHEDFIGMYALERTTADHIVAVLKNCLISMHLRIENARGQCYDGASTMAGEKTGVATQIKALNSKCLYTHCYDLQQYKLEAQLSLLPGVVQAMGYETSRSTSLICWTFFSHSEMLANSY